VSYNLYEYVNYAGKSTFSLWANALAIAQRAKLQVKLNLLRTVGPDLPPTLLAGTSSGHIKKLKVKGNVQLRPRLCIGPIDQGREFSLLLGVTEVNMKSVPPDADEIAVQRRLDIIADKEQRRCLYVS